MKIALVNKLFSLSHGGGERVAVNLAVALHHQGHEVHVIAHRAEDLPPAIPIHLVPMARTPSFRRLRSFARNVRQPLAQHSFDLVYGLTQIYPQDIYRMGGGVHRHWLCVRYPFPPRRLFACLVNFAHLAQLSLERQIFKPGNYRFIVSNSQLGKAHARQYYGVPPERIAVIYNGVDHDVFSPQAVAEFRQPVRRRLGLSSNDLALLFVASNWSRKGLAVILQALNALGDRGRCCHVVVVGRGKPARYRRLARQLGLAQRVHFVGQSDQIPQYYGAGDLLVLPTLYDPFANVCLEAMACGLPVITTAANGASEIVRHGESGYIQQQPCDAQELGELLAHCLDAGRRGRLGRAARQAALRFTLEENLRRTLSVCQRVLDERET